MSRALCNRILFLGFAIALAVVLNYTLFVKPAGNLAAAVPEIVGKTALLGPGVALVLGVLAEAFLLLTGRWRSPQEEGREQIWSPGSSPSSASSWPSPSS